MDWVVVSSILLLDTWNRFQSLKNINLVKKTALPTQSSKQIRGRNPTIASGWTDLSWLFLPLWGNHYSWLPGSFTILDILLFYSASLTGFFRLTLYFRVDQALFFLFFSFLNLNSGSWWSIHFPSFYTFLHQYPYEHIDISI